MITSPGGKRWVFFYVKKKVGLCSNIYFELSGNVILYCLEVSELLNWILLINKRLAVNQNVIKVNYKPHFGLATNC